MAERIESVRLIANISNYVAGMELARAKTLQLANDSTAKLALQGQAFREVGVAALAVGAIAAAGVALAVKSYADFDQAMSNVKAATQETTENMVLLRDAALEAGAKTVFTAVEAANAIEELGKNGLTTAQILDGGLSGALALASAGQLEVARAAEIASITMKQFGLTGADIPHIADLLAAGAGKAAGSVDDMAQALAQSGLVAHQYGLSVEETTGLLAAFADQGLIGSDAGTSLKTMLQSLTPSSEQAKGALRDLGVSAYDASGQFIGIAKFAGLYSDAMHKLTPEQQSATSKIIFGSDAVRASNVLYDLGAKGIQKYVDQTNDAGYAAKVAADRLDNLKGDIEQLGGSFDSFLIKSGSGANATLREMTQALTFLINTAGDVPQPVLDGALAFTVVTASITLAGGAALIGVPKFVAFRTALSLTGISGKTAAVGIGAVGIAIGIATIIISEFISTQAEAAATTAAFRDSLDQTTGAVTVYSRELIAKQLVENGTIEGVKRLGISQAELTDAILNGGDALDEIKAKTTGDFYSSLGFQSAGLTTNIESLRDSVVQGQKDFKDLDQATDGSSVVVDEFSGKITQASFDINALADDIRNLGKAQLDVNSATRNFEAAIDDLTDSVKQNGSSLDVTTEAGRANQSALDDIAKSAFDVAQSTLEQTGRQEDATAAIARGRAELILALGQFGITGEAAEQYADTLGLIPTVVSTATEVTGIPENEAKVNTFIATLTGKKITMDIFLNPLSKPGTTIPGFMKGYADGGFTGAIGKASVAGFVHGNEFVSNAKTTANPNNRAALEYMHAGGVIRGYAGGGFVTPTYLAAPVASPSQLDRSVSPSSSQHVTELNQFLLDGRVVAEVVRDYDRSLK